nr:MAG: Protein of unknown function (DUF1642) [Bacteriophage sp.]
MDRQEAIQTLSKVGKISVSYAEDLYDSFVPKPVVKQYVADWYEGNNDEFEINLFQCIGELVECYDKDSSSKFEDWLMDDDIEALTTLINMHQFGYEVENEKRYTVRVKGIGGYSKCLNRDTKTQKWLFASKTELERFRAHHTRKELEEAGFGWVFNCEGVEVKEVADE